MFAKILDIWVSGGWVMIPLALLAVLIFATGINLVLRLRGDNFRLGDPTVWFDWIRDPAGADPRFGEVLRYATENVSAARHIQSRFEEIRQAILEPVTRRLVFLSVLIAVAPLMGLFGTVLGMLGIFDALAAGGGGKETTGLVAHGISQALITTQTGLFIALPGLFVVLTVRVRKHAVEADLARIESLCLSYHKLD